MPAAGVRSLHRHAADLRGGRRQSLLVVDHRPSPSRSAHGASPRTAAARRLLLEPGCPHPGPSHIDGCAFPTAGCGATPPCGSVARRSLCEGGTIGWRRDWGARRGLLRPGRGESSPKQSPARAGRGSGRIRLEPFGESLTPAQG